MSDLPVVVKVASEAQQSAENCLMASATAAVLLSCGPIICVYWEKASTNIIHNGNVVHGVRPSWKGPVRCPCKLFRVGVMQ